MSESGRESLLAAGRPSMPLASPLRTPEQMEWIHDRFKIDGLERLARSTQDYYDQKGYYLPDVAALAHAALLEVERLRGVLADEIAMAEQSAETLRDLHRNWERMVDEKDDDGVEPLITNILFWLIEDVDPSGAREALDA